MKAVIVPVTPFQQNCTVIWCPDTMKGAVVDPGGEIDRILAAAQQNGVTIEKVLLTHGHLDHCSAARVLADRLSVPLEGPHEEDRFWIDRLKEDCARYGFPETEAFASDRWLIEGDTVTVGNRVLDVYHCPGHTPGHVVFHDREAGIAWVGDVLFQGSVGRSDFPRGDGPTLVRSIVEKLWPLGDETVFIPGHGPYSTFGEERRSNPFVADHVVGG
ncbi:MAG: MBL fold metallo-hydrolase [Alphaproteobacteria bacterium]|uniref:MBL fold metallo-hydrolase n=1 Tax=Pacificispira sp. TaxID=2888761 RepID=UPI001B19C37D|nr:MBL fold metallo-hydrolase [Alphaproteobacteria bacterium]MBO6862672.1 MBL fold metallo-hydrolase [Alphaproteobacteria bacterium]